MKLLSDDEEATEKILFLYSGATAVISSFTIFGLLQTKLFSLVGSGKIFPLFVFLIFFEILKWCSHVIILKKVYTVRKNKIFSLLYKSVNFSSLIRSLFILFICCIGFYVITVLFGAEILNKQEETLMFSILLTLLTAFPIAVQLGNYYVENFIQGVKPANKFQSLLYNNSRGAIMGAWVGAFVIPLDWDRPWQVWPIPCFLGALMGYSISNWFHFCKSSLTKSKLSF